jgi:hypothetical protein
LVKLSASLFEAQYPPPHLSSSSMTHTALPHIGICNLSFSSPTQVSTLPIRLGYQQRLCFWKHIRDHWGCGRGSFLWIPWPKLSKWPRVGRFGHGKSEVRGKDNTSVWPLQLLIWKQKKVRSQEKQVSTW